MAQPHDTQAILNTISSILHEYKQLSAEAQKYATKYSTDARYTELYSTCERACIELKVLTQPNKVSQNVPILQLQSSIIYTPLLYTCQTKQLKLIVLCMGIIQRLIVLEPLDTVFIQTVISILYTYVELNDSVIQLKILQSLLQLIRINTIQSITGTGILQCINITIKLKQSKDKMISNTAVATLQQIVDILFEYVSIQHAQNKLYEIHTNGHSNGSGTTTDIEAQIKTPPESPRLTQYSVSAEAEQLNDVAKHTYILLTDLCNLLYNDEQHRTQLFNKQHTLPPTVALDAIELVLQHNKALLSQQPAFKYVLMHFVVPALIALLHNVSPKPDTFPATLRAVRCVTLLLKQYYTVDEAVTTKLIQSLIQLLNSKTLWHQLLAAESFNQLQLNVEFMYYIFAAGSLISSTPIYTTLLNVLSNYINSIDNYNAANDTGSDTLYVWRLMQSSKVKYLEQLGEDKPQDKLDSAEVNTLVIDTLCKVIHNLNTLLTQAADTASQHIKQQYVTDMIDAAWLPLLNVIAFLLNRTIDTAQTRYLFTTLQNLIDVCGAVNLSKARDNLVYSLCSFALPRHLCQHEYTLNDIVNIITSTPQSPDQQPLLNAKNTQALNVVFIMIKSLNEHLDSSWLCILETMQQLDMIVSACDVIEQRRQRDNSIGEHIVAMLPSKDELTVLHNNLSHISNSTVNMGDAGVTAIVTALGTLSLSMLANAPTEPTAAATAALATASLKLSDAAVQPIQSFALSNLIRIVELNMSRLLRAQLWEQIVTHLATVISHRNSSIRQFGLSTLIKLTVDALTNKELHSNDVDNSEMVQTRLLTPLYGLWRNKYDDTRDSLLQAVHTIIQSVGTTLHTGWSIILQLLQAVVTVDKEQTQQPMSAKHVASGFSSVQLICNDYLDIIPITLYDQLIHAVADYCKQPADTNISFTSIGLLWRVSDHLLHTNTNIKSGSRDAAADALLYTIFVELHQLSTDVRSEVRNSACKTLYSTISAHAVHATDATLLTCMQQLLLPLLSELLTHNDKSSSNAHGTELGTDKSGNKVMMLAHYSRNTAAKQWNETCVYALQGSTQLIKLLIQTHNTMPQLYQLIQQYIQTMQYIFVTDNSEVTVAAISSAADILLTAHNNPAIWRTTVDMYLHCINVVVQDISQQTDDSGFQEWLRTTTQLVASIELIISSDLNHALKAQYCKLLIEAVQKLLNAFAADKSKSTQITSLHMAYLQLCQNCVTASDDVVVLIMGQLLKIMAGDTSTQNQFDAHSKAVAMQDGVVKLPACTLKYQPNYAVSYTNKAMKSFDQLYCKCDNTYIRSIMFEPALTVLCSILTHYSPLYATHTDVIDCSVNVLSHILQYGLHAVNARGYTSNVAHKLFTTIYRIFAMILDPEHSDDKTSLLDDVDVVSVPVRYHTPRNSAAEQQQYEQLQMHIIDCMVQSMLPHSSRASSALLKRVLLLLSIHVDYSAKVEPANNLIPYQTVSLKCTETLFELCSISYIHTEEQLRIAELAAPLLVARLRNILQTYIKTIQSTFITVSTTLHEHVLYILNELLKHKLPEFSLYHAANNGGTSNGSTTPETHARTILTPKKMLRKSSYGRTSSGNERDATVLLQGSSTYIIQLLPLLCDCIITEDKDIRLVLSSVIKLVTNDLQQISSIQPIH